jgi:hypothetical protein
MHFNYFQFVFFIITNDAEIVYFSANIGNVSEKFLEVE